LLLCQAEGRRSSIDILGFFQHESMQLIGSVTVKVGR
jgi:hypothetical protein